jgi:catechol 2,3-dioxygenase-like lactoylglutathione lyase family enzyme
MNKDAALHLGVHSIDHFCLSVPDLKEARHFYTHFGLDVREVHDGIELYSFGNDQRWGAIRRGTKKRLQYISLLAYPEDIERFRHHFASLGIKSIQPPPSASVGDGGIWIETPEGLPIHLGPGAKNSPDEHDRIMPTGRHSIERGAPVRGTTPQTRPQRLSHILIFTASLDGALDFFGKALGLRLSDRSGGVAFMHGAHGSDHHLLAFAQSNGYGLHHSAWTVKSIDEIGLGSERMRENGYSRGWGLGRHVLGSNYFRYVRDPWGSYAEYSFDIDFVRAAEEWDVWTPPPENSLYIWGPEVPEDFITNYETIEEGNRP